MSHEDEEALFDRILSLLEAQEQLLREKLSREDHARFSAQSEQIRTLVARLTHGAPAGRG